VHAPTECANLPVRRNRDGTFRTYVEYRVPDPAGGNPKIIREPTYNRDDDAFNRAENIRQIPRGDPDYERLMGRRSRAVTANRQIDDHLYVRRAEASAPVDNSSTSSPTPSSRTPSRATAIASGPAQPATWPPERARATDLRQPLALFGPPPPVVRA